MRTHGTLNKWNDDRGFGFITPAKGPPDIFVHISEFPREGGRPAQGELISFEVVPGPDGKQRAVRVMRPGQQARRMPAMREKRQAHSRWLSPAITLLIVSVIAAYGYTKYTQSLDSADHAMPQQAFEVVSPPERITEIPAEFAPPPERALPSQIAEPNAAASPYACDGRTMCSQMRSCAEATYFIRNCPNTKMDGNGDGVPCESQWCRY